MKDRNTFLIVLGHFLSACNYRYFWRFDRDCYRLALMMKKQNYESLIIEKVLNSIQKSKMRKKAERDLISF